MNYQEIYNKIINNAKERVLSCYKENHHITPKCLGGSNEKNNLVNLTAKEHFICHMLLAEIYPNNNKLKYAIWMMVNINRKDQQRYKISARVYKRLREECAKNSSKDKKGVKRPQSVINKLTGRKFTQEMKDKIKATHWSKGPNAEQIKLKLRLARIGKKRSEETNKKILSKQIGQKRSEETKLKISIASSSNREHLKKKNGFVMSEEVKAKMRLAAKTKKPISIESRLKISLSKLGKPRSEETKRKLSESHKGKPAWNKGIKGSTWKKCREV